MRIPMIPVSDSGDFDRASRAGYFLLAYSDPNRPLIPGNFQGSCRIFMPSGVLFPGLAIQFRGLKANGTKTYASEVTV